jgi:hypothetical protein
MVLLPVFCPRWHTDQVVKGGKTPCLWFVSYHLSGTTLILTNDSNRAEIQRG